MIWIPVLCMSISLFCWALCCVLLVAYDVWMTSGWQFIAVLAVAVVCAKCALRNLNDVMCECRRRKS